MPAHNLCAAPAKSVADQRPFFRMDSRREYIDQVAVYFTRYLRTKSCLMPSPKFDIIDASAYISPSELVFVILSLSLFVNYVGLHFLSILLSDSLFSISLSPSTFRAVRETAVIRQREMNVVHAIQFQLLSPSIFCFLLLPHIPLISPSSLYLFLFASSVSIKQPSARRHVVPIGREFSSFFFFLLFCFLLFDVFSFILLANGSIRTIGIESWAGPSFDCSSTCSFRLRLQQFR